MSKRQIAWAKQHDWYIDSKDGQVLVSGGWTHINGTAGHDVKVFSDFSKLYRWAGY